MLNLASKEYSRTVEPHLPHGIRFLTCIFGELKGRKFIEKGTIFELCLLIFIIEIWKGICYHGNDKK